MISIGSMKNVVTIARKNLISALRLILSFMVFRDHGWISIISILGICLGWFGVCSEMFSEVLICWTCIQIKAIFGFGWEPPCLWSDPVRWRHREHNKKADWLCNYTMDRAATWEHVVDIDISPPFNLLIHSDGGSRAECAAAAWLVESIDLNGTLQLVAMAGIYIPQKLSSFEAEGIALSACTNFCCKFMRSSSWSDAKKM